MAESKLPKRTILPEGWVLVVDRQESLKKLQNQEFASLAISAIEIRIDLWQGPFPAPQELLGLSVLVTSRNCPKGSQKAQQRDDLCSKLEAVLDVDPQTDAPAPDQLPWIYSCHRSEKTQATAAQQIAEAQQLGAAAIKIVWPAGASSETSMNHKKALAVPAINPNFPIVSFCATHNAAKHRREALDRGQPWGYARIDPALADIPGLPTLQQLLQEPLQDGPIQD
ncbi:MAG: hypothetical protein AAEJ04_11425 [Planctomycetota bacterium]